RPRPVARRKDARRRRRCRCGGNSGADRAYRRSGRRTRIVRAEAKITVQSSEAEPYDQTASPALLEIRITETFTGDIEGASVVRALELLRDDRSACLVSLQRVSGKLDGRQGTF